MLTRPNEIVPLQSDRVAMEASSPRESPGKRGEVWGTGAGERSRLVFSTQRGGRCSGPAFAGPESCSDAFQTGFAAGDKPVDGVDSLPRTRERTCANLP